ncbi:D-alanyl-D-alanine carboxypeptidase family protein [Streptomyces scopuliridis]|uniref:D-alanyl-D-alanine carboxypeptidase n=1 Tax=Streptomyces scopuliridis RB72 TaxID=1440053 RepID=A0A2T7T5A2_9ACTN|nr:D-alanyl-D-alanine carboxypeptidase [Streptomyces scopuliridis RB72]
MTTSPRALRAAHTTALITLTAGALLTVTTLAAPAQAATPPAAASAVTSQAVAAPVAPAPAVAAKGALLVDDASGDTVFEKDAGTGRRMASTTKIMTAAVVLDARNLDLDREVTVQQAYRDYVAANGTSTADLRTGDRLTVRQLLYATMLPSGSDAAYALADTYGTGATREARTASFIAKMNAKAAELGLGETVFASFDGIGTDTTTPRDLAKLAQHTMNDATFRTIVKTTSYKSTAPAANGGTRTYTWYNTNQLLGSYEGVTGIKTGTSTPAGLCLVFAATRGGKTVVGVVLNSTNQYADAAALLDYGFGMSTAKTMKLRKLPAGAQRD